VEGGQRWPLGDGATARRFDRLPVIVVGFTRGVFGESGGGSMTRRANILVEAIVKSTTAGRGFSVVIKVRFAVRSTLAVLVAIRGLVIRLGLEVHLDAGLATGCVRILALILGKLIEGLRLVADHAGEL